MTLQDLRTLCTDRRSIRWFSNKKLTKEDVLKLLDIAHLAPSVDNAQPWHFHIIFDQVLRDRLMEASCYGNFVSGAACFVVVTARHMDFTPSKQPVWNPKEIEYSCMAAIDHLLLAATAAGLGTCFVSLHHGTAHEILDLDQKQIIVGGVMLGHLKEGEEHATEEHNRKPLDNLVTIYS
jgi:nitroreductase